MKYGNLHFKNTSEPYCCQIMCILLTVDLTKILKYQNISLILTIVVMALRMIFTKKNLKPENEKTFQ
jgi:hypothetical protein